MLTFRAPNGGGEKQRMRWSVRDASMSEGETFTRRGSIWRTVSVPAVRLLTQSTSLSFGKRLRSLSALDLRPPRMHTSDGSAQPAAASPRAHTS